MRISAHTFATNPRSQGYLAYLPAIQSFLDFADEVIVDGGSTDGSIEALSRLWGSERLKVFSSDQTLWGPGDAWEMPQYGIQRQVGFELCAGDWAIAFDADHVLPESGVAPLREQPERRADSGILYAFRVIGCRNAHYAPDKKIRRWCINKRLARTRGIPIGWGLERRTGGGERPIPRRAWVPGRGPRPAAQVAQADRSAHSGVRAAASLRTRPARRWSLGRYRMSAQGVRPSLVICT
jgi:hypothetical protein